jgi:hypothetical protein
MARAAGSGAAVLQVTHRCAAPGASRLHAVRQATRRQPPRVARSSLALTSSSAKRGTRLGRHSLDGAAGWCRAGSKRLRCGASRRGECERRHGGREASAPVPRVRAPCAPAPRHPSPGVTHWHSGRKRGLRVALGNASSAGGRRRRSCEAWPPQRTWRMGGPPPVPAPAPALAPAPRSGAPRGGGAASGGSSRAHRVGPHLPRAPCRSWRRQRRRCRRRTPLSSGGPARCEVGRSGRGSGSAQQPRSRRGARRGPRLAQGEPARSARPRPPLHALWGPASLQQPRPTPGPACEPSGLPPAHSSPPRLPRRPRPPRGSTPPQPSPAGGRGRSPDRSRRGCSPLGRSRP